MALFIAVRLWACECIVPTICERLDNASVVFLGEVVEGGIAPGEDPWSGAISKARLKVLEAFGGVPKGAREGEIDLFFISGMCSPSPYRRGKRVLVFLNSDDDDATFKDGPCPQSIGSEYVDRELGTVRKYFAAR